MTDHHSVEASSQYPEKEGNNVEKAAVLAWLVPESLHDEISEVAERGYDITIGSTYDVAYDQPERIASVYDRLDVGGREFARQSRQLVLGSSTLAQAVEFTPLAPLAATRRKIRSRREDFRGDILYNQPDVQGWAWHQQNGKAVALGTIVDAHDLRTYDSENGAYDTIGGRLNRDLLSYTFPTDNVSENLSGKSLWRATMDAKLAFRGGRSQDESIASARRDYDKLDAFLTAPVYPGFKDIVAYCTDSLGIRSRKEEVRAEINRYTDASDKESFLMMSVGCGTALPMLEVMHDVIQKGKSARMILIDQDPIALAAAGELARQFGVEDAVEIHCKQLFVRDGIKTKVMNLDDVLEGRTLDICEDSGLREYFPDAMYEDLTRQAWNALEDGGLMTTGNMNKNRPQPEFLHGLMGWPIPVRMRNINDITRLHAKAGVPAESSRLRVTQDGVYTLCFSTK